MPTKESSSMLGILKKHLDTAKTGCVVGKWIDTLSQDEQEAFALIKEKNSLVSLNGMFEELNQHQELPFGVTSFRGHFRGKCQCQKTF